MNRRRSRSPAALRRSALVALLGAAVLSIVFAATAHVSAQTVQPGVTLQDLGGQTVTGAGWSFDGDFAITAGAWESVTISNYGYCFVGPNDPRAGSAHAGAVFWFAELAASPPDASGYGFSGDLMSGRGGDVTGHVTVTTSPGADPSSPPTTRIDAMLSGAGLNDYQDNTLEVCLLGSS